MMISQTICREVLARYSLSSTLIQIRHAGGVCVIASERERERFGFEIVLEYRYRISHHLAGIMSTRHPE